MSVLLSIALLARACAVALEVGTGLLILGVGGSGIVRMM